MSPARPGVAREFTFRRQTSFPEAPPTPRAGPHGENLTTITLRYGSRVTHLLHTFTLLVVLHARYSGVVTSAVQRYKIDSFCKSVNVCRPSVDELLSRTRGVIFRPFCAAARLLTRRPLPPPRFSARLLPYAANESKTSMYPSKTRGRPQFARTRKCRSLRRGVDTCRAFRRDYLTFERNTSKHPYITSDFGKRLRIVHRVGGYIPRTRRGA